MKALSIFISILSLFSIAQAAGGKCKIDTKKNLKMENKKEIFAVFDTSMGKVKAKLFHTLAPNTVANFVGLAEGTQKYIDYKTGLEVTNKPFYKNLTFHRVIPNFMIQGGCPKGDGTSGPGCSFDDEIRPELKHSKKGILSMANSGPNSNGSQFFITVAPTNWLDGKHSIFGEVVEGMEIVEKISKVATLPGNKPIETVKINAISIERL